MKVERTQLAHPRVQGRRSPNFLDKTYSNELDISRSSIKYEEMFTRNPYKLPNATVLFTKLDRLTLGSLIGYSHRIGQMPSKACVVRLYIVNNLSLGVADRKCAFVTFVSM
jgi:hypothetical protein